VVALIMPASMQLCQRRVGYQAKSKPDSSYSMRLSKAVMHSILSQTVSL
jgi:hypothetical protein